MDMLLLQYSRKHKDMKNTEKISMKFSVLFMRSLSNTDHTYASGGTGATSVDVSYTLPKGKGIAIVTKYGYPYSEQPFTPTITSGICTIKASYTDAYYQTGIIDIDSSDGATLTVNVYYGYTGGGHPEAQLVYLY